MINTFTVHAVGHTTVFTYTDRVDAGIHAQILESVGYTVVVRESRPAAKRVAIAAIAAALSLTACTPMHRETPMQTWQCPGELSGYCHAY